MLGAILGAVAVLLTAIIAATWTLANRIGRVDSKLDRHLGYHEGRESVTRSASTWPGPMG